MLLDSIADSFCLVVELIFAFRWPGECLLIFSDLAGTTSAAWLPLQACGHFQDETSVEDFSRLLGKRIMSGGVEEQGLQNTAAVRPLPHLYSSRPV